MSTEFNPKVECQMELMNACMETYLLIVVNDRQDDCKEWLPVSVFAEGNGRTEMTKCTPFVLIPGTNPWMSLAGKLTTQKD